MNFEIELIFLIKSFLKGFQWSKNANLFGRGESDFKLDTATER